MSSTSVFPPFVYSDTRAQWETLAPDWSRFRGDGLAGALLAEAEVPWGDVARYYHFYGPVELVTDCRAAGFVEVDITAERVSSSAGWLPDNWFVTLRT